MKNTSKLLPAMLLSLMVSACGSDSDDDTSVTPPSEPTKETQEQAKTGTGVFEGVWGPDINFQLEGPIWVYLENNTRIDMTNQFQGGTPPTGIRIEAADVRELIPTLWGKEELERRIYHENQITFADVLLYMGETRKDFDVVYSWNDDLSTYQYKVSYDKNGDGDFDDEGDYKLDPNWYSSFMIDFGEFRRELMYESKGEVLYRRLELTHVQPNSGILFIGYSEAMTKRREELHKEQADRRRAAEAKYGENTIIFPHVELKPIGTREDYKSGETLIFENVKVTPHNMRPDIYKKDAAITLADVLLSMEEQGLVDVGFTYWGKLATGVDVQHFFLNEINGKKASGSIGYTIQNGTKRAMHDFSSKYLTGYLVWGMGTQSSYCDWTGQDDPYGKKNPDGTPLQVADGKLDIDNPECNPEITGVDIDVTDWFADMEMHFFTDVWVVNYPGDYFEAKAFSMYGMYAENDSKRFADDGKWPVHDIKEAVAPLTKEHFGWGVADCGTCHSLEGIHSEGDMGTLGVNKKPVYVRDDVESYSTEDKSELVIAPYQCANCHGSNGAPKGHGEDARCFWCHSEEFVPPNHGAISKYTTFGEITSEEQPGGNDPRLMFSAGEIIDIPTTDTEKVKAIEAEYQQKYFYLPHAENVRFDMLAPHEGVSWQGNWGKYPDEMKTRTNSDWFTDPTFPDPYSCATCHPSE